ncbi:hypothetical protein DFH09DRAFT_1081096 [Mycena vulgaris]|nr:hypothetical protein DFH09DRAFT_1081096 [Mycena vulgaris]
MNLALSIINLAIFARVFGYQEFERIVGWANRGSSAIALGNFDRNTGIGTAETRYSFTQFTPAGIFQWVYNDFQMDEAVERSVEDGSGEAWAQRRQELVNRWQEGIHLYRTWPS